MTRRKVKETTSVKRIAEVERKANSVNGNPRYLVRFTDGTAAMTWRDADVNYGIGNSDLRGVDLNVTFEHGQVTQVERVDGRGGA